MEIKAKYDPRPIRPYEWDSAEHLAVVLYLTYQNEEEGPYEHALERLHDVGYSPHVGWYVFFYVTSGLTPLCFALLCFCSEGFFFPYVCLLGCLLFACISLSIETSEEKKFAQEVLKIVSKLEKGIHLYIREHKHNRRKALQGSIELHSGDMEGRLTECLNGAMEVVK